MRTVAILALMTIGCAPEWRMKVDRERECNQSPYHLWVRGECRRVR